MRSACLQTEALPSIFFAVCGNNAIVPASEALFQRGLEFYCSRADQEWSLTDCISFVVMRDEKLTEALTGDHHFEQAGFVALLS